MVRKKGDSVHHKPETHKREIDPNDVLAENKRFIILKNGDVVPHEEAVVRKQVCKTCNHVREVNELFYDGECVRCSMKKINEELSKVDTETDACVFPTSSMFKDATYRPAQKTLTLFLRKTGVPLIYLDVPESVWKKLITADSAGKFYNEKIKGHFLQQLDHAEVQ